MMEAMTQMMFKGYEEARVALSALLFTVRPRALSGKCAGATRLPSDAAASSGSMCAARGSSFAAAALPKP